MGTPELGPDRDEQHVAIVQSYDQAPEAVLGVDVPGSRALQHGVELVDETVTRLLAPNHAADYAE